MRAFVLSCLIALAPCAAAAQQNGNVYDGTAHEPAAGDVNQKERATGLAQPAPVQRRENEDVEKLGDQVLRQSRQTMPPDPPRPTNEPGR